MAGTERLITGSACTSTPTRTDDLANGGPTFDLSTTRIFTDGLNAGQVGHVYISTRTLAASGTETLDLYGSLLSDCGETVNGSKLRYIKVVNVGPGNLQVTRPGANGVPLFIAASDGIELEPDDEFVFSSKTGKTVTNVTAQDLTFTESSTTSGITYKIVMGLRGI